MNIWEEFENATTRLYEKMGFWVEKGKEMKGCSGIVYKIDVYATKRNFLGNEKNVLVECKYRNGENIGIDEVAKFLLVLDDTREKEGHIVTNTDFSDQAYTLGKTYNLRLINGEEFVELCRRYRVDFHISESNLENPFSYIASSALSLFEDVGLLKSIRKKDSKPHNWNQKNSEHIRPFFNLSMLKQENDEILDVNELILIEKPNVYFDNNIGGLEQVKEALKLSVIYPKIRKDLYAIYDKSPNNVLLYGPPGCGKTLLAKAVATEFDGTFISPKISDIMRKWVGESEQLISKIFGYCRNNQNNCVLFFDELDSIMPRSGPSYMQRIKNEFLEQMDGISSNKENVIVLGATNKPWLVDVAIRRPGRFGKLIFVPPPDKQERSQILKIYLKNLVTNNMIEGDLHKLLEDLTVKTNGWSGDDIRQLIDDAKERPLLEAIKGKNHRKLTTEDFEYALSKRQPSVNPWFIEAIKACKRYNEEKLLKDILKHTPSFMEIKNDEL